MNNNAKEIMDRIFDIDTDVYAEVSKRNLSEEALLNVLEKISKPVTSVTCKMCAVNNTEPSGCKVRFINQYNTLVMEDMDETIGRISVNNTWVSFDISVVRVIKSLLIVGVSKDEEISTKCREIVNKILVLGSHSPFVSQRDVIERLNLKKGKFEGIEKELMSAIKEVLK